MDSRADEILCVRDLRVWYPIRRGIFARTTGYVKAVDGVSFAIRRGETVGLVGESGCGKSTICRAVLGLVKPTKGEILFRGKALPAWRSLDYHRKVQVVFQDPFGSLNPRHTVETIITEGAVYHGLCPKEESIAFGKDLLARVGLSSDCLPRYPHEFSGGQRQRICLARALALQPELLICDEAVSALDLSVRAQILSLIDELKRAMNLSILFVTHDLGVVQHVASRILVMNRGHVVEEGPCSEVLSHPKDPYTCALTAAVPKIGRPFSTTASLA